jgi:predicted nicotinamide N-methyase
MSECYNNIKKISIYSNNGCKKIDILINEFFTRDMKNMFIWPSSLVLSSYVASNHHIFKDKSILEISAGVGLPSIMAAKVGARNCIITEQGIDNKDNLILENIRKNVTSNSVDHICNVSSLQWGIITEVPYCDIILGSDLFYSTESFNDILSSVASLMIINQNIIFLTTYQERR